MAIKKIIVKSNKKVILSIHTFSIKANGNRSIKSIPLFIKCVIMMSNFANVIDNNAT